MEVHAVLAPELAPSTVQACAFVAAESLSICNEHPDVLAAVPAPSPSPLGSVRRYEQLEAGLLYRIAGYDANAARCADAIGDLDTPPDVESPVSEWTLHTIRDLLSTRSGRDLSAPPPVPGPETTLAHRVRDALWRRLGGAVQRHARWLTYQPGGALGAIGEVREVIGLLRADADEPGSPDIWPSHAAHSDIHHLAVLLAEAMGEGEVRSLRSVSPPDDDGDGRFARYVREQAASRPLLWPAARLYAESVLPGPDGHAVVCVPTGAGKSSVAELAIAQTLHRGWVLYLAPTNALVGQVERRLRAVFGGFPGVTVRGFIGGAEYTTLGYEDLGLIEPCQVLVMTPEKCSLALRQNPDAFDDLQLCVLDEAHLIDEPGGRGALTELVMAEVLHRAPDVRALLLSALIANVDELAQWLDAATGVDAVPINHPWRPTRTLRAIAGFDLVGDAAARSRAGEALAVLPSHRKNIGYQSPVSLLVGLQGAWRTSAPADYAVVQTSLHSPRTLHRADGPVSSGVCFPMTSVLVQALAENDHRVLAFLPKNRHDSFSQAVKLPGDTGWVPRDRDPEIDALLTLSDAELGVASELRTTLAKGVGVHTGALLREEQRASELAFDRGRIRVLFATGTLSQGLNLPATAVVIGGTGVGYDAGESLADRERRSRTQLLNAIGRAGRAYTSARSVAVVVPTHAAYVAPHVNGSATARAAEATFLTHEDAANRVTSRLDGLIEKVLGDTLEVTTLEAEEQSAFSFLAFAADSGDAPGVVGRTWAVHRAGAADEAAPIAAALEVTGASFLAREDVPQWVSLAAHRAGLGLPETSLLYRLLFAELGTNEPPDTVTDWGRLLVAFLAAAPPDARERLLPLIDVYKSTAIEELWSPEPASAGRGHRALWDTLLAWLRGEDLASVAVHALGLGSAADVPDGRGRSGLLPKIIGLTDKGFGFRLSILAGALGSIVATACESEPDPGRWELPEQSYRALGLLPFGIRWGADGPGTIAWLRAGVRPRVLAHLLERRMPLASDGYWMDDEDLRRLATRQLTQRPEQVLWAMADEGERRLASAMLRVRV
ncbi:DEAD/DEAH box helicase [Streptomyces sp. NPDC004732]|uniref:DEAD/DEAH box helicase n=1 Tax=Streptomyces sp. NPDC004732 TaxID=3154290 RepID=UPI0033B61412